MSRLYVDMDGTLAEFKTVGKLEQLYEPRYFYDLAPIGNAVAAVKQIAAQEGSAEVFILSAYLPDDSGAILADKNRWLDRYLPEIDWGHRIFVECGTCKADPGNWIHALPAQGGHKPAKHPLIDEGSYLLDDYTKNLREWAVAGGTGIKMLNQLNGNTGSWNGNSVYFNSTRLPEQIQNCLAGKLVQDRVYLRMDIEDMLKQWNRPEARRGQAENNSELDAFGLGLLAGEEHASIYGSDLNHGEFQGGGATAKEPRVGLVRSNEDDPRNPAPRPQGSKLTEQEEEANDGHKRTAGILDWQAE